MHNKTKTNTEPPLTVESTLNNRSTTTEPLPYNGQQTKPPGVRGLNAFYWRQTFTLDSAVAQSRHESTTNTFTTIAHPKSSKHLLIALDDHLTKNDIKQPYNKTKDTTPTATQWKQQQTIN